jgi:hypothetical protein
MMKSIGLRIILVSAILLLAAATTWAQDWYSAGGNDASCENGSTKGCVGELLDSQGDMIDALGDYMDTLESESLFSFLRAQNGGVDIQPEISTRLETLRQEHQRGKNTHKATTEDEYEEMLANGDKEQGKKCKSSDINFYNSLEDEGYLPPGLSYIDDNRFGNGKCDVFQADDLDNNSVLVNERKENMCEQVCVEKKDAEGNSIKGNSKKRANARLTEAKFSVETTTRALRAHTASISSMGLGSALAKVRSSATSFPSIQNGEDPCSPDDAENGYLTAELVLQIIITTGNVIAIVTDIGVEILEATKDVFDSTAKTTIAGFNVAASKVPLQIIFHVAKGINDVYKGIIQGVVDAKDIVGISAEFDEAYKATQANACTKLIRDQYLDPSGAEEPDTGIIFTMKQDISALKISSSGTSAKVDNITKELELLKTLLVMPEGQRDKYLQAQQEPAAN